jgi:hypothetical protein
MWLLNLRTTKLATSLVLVVLVLTPLLGFGVSASQTDVPSDNVWVLTETLVNPDDVPTEYYGGGTTPGYYGDARYEGKHRKYTVTPTSFTIDDRSVDHGYEYHWVIVQANFKEPPTMLVPGESIALDAWFQAEGTVNEGNGFGMQFWYSGDGITLQPAGVFWYVPWHPEFDGTSSTTYTLDIPRAYSGGEIAIHVGLWNEPPCHVVWKYRAVAPAEDERIETTPTADTRESDTGADEPGADDTGATETGATDEPGAEEPSATDTPGSETGTDQPGPPDTDTPDTGGGVLQGDCVKDGRLDERDASCALRMSVGLRLPDLAIDMDGSGGVTSRDATLILQQANVSRAGP